MMRKPFTVLVALLLTASIFAQAPNRMSYQAVIRNSSGTLVTSTQIGIEINIHQGSPTGTVVYTETQTPTTNANGLVSIEIGGGAGFSSIKWASDNYYIETKTAVVAPLTTYTITGVNQLMSVPYALNAKTAESITGTITETDPVYTNSQAANITETDIANLGNLAGTNTGDQDLSGLATKTALVDSIAQVRSEIPDVSGFLTSETDPVYSSSVASSITASDTTNWNNKQDKFTHYVGELYGGGVVFWVDHTEQHGLIVSIVDLSTSQAWSNITSIAIGTTNDWDGAANTTAIIGQSGHTSSAAKLCKDYTNDDYGSGTFNDWYLPSRGELNDLWYNLKTIQKALESDGNATTTTLKMMTYWSSTEYVYNCAYVFNFFLGYMGDPNGCAKSSTRYVRAVRAF